VNYCKLRLGLARAVTLRSKSRRTNGFILLSHPRLHQPGGPGPRISKSLVQCEISNVTIGRAAWEACSAT
jgi:hypothetical protein